MTLRCFIVTGHVLLISFDFTVLECGEKARHGF